MGNRAVMTTKDAMNEDGTFKRDAIGIYVHWNGSQEDVQEFLDLAKDKGVRRPEHDNYGWARLCQIIGEEIGGYELSVGIDILERLDCNNWDNGVYVFDDWKIIKQFDEIRLV